MLRAVQLCSDSLRTVWTFAYDGLADLRLRVHRSGFVCIVGNLFSKSVLIFAATH